MNAEYSEKIEYSAEDAGFYSENIRRLELGDHTAEEEKFIVSELLSRKPADYRVFYFANREYPEEADNLAAVAKFWEVEPLSEEEMETLSSAHTCLTRTLTSRDASAQAMRSPAY